MTDWIGDTWKRLGRHARIFDSHLFYVETVVNVISDLKRDKAAGRGEITSAYQLFSNAALTLVLARLVSMMLINGVLPDNFCVNYTTTIHKTDSTGGNELDVSDFRGISICSVITKVFENCVNRRSGSFLLSSDHRVGF